MGNIFLYVYFTCSSNSANQDDILNWTYMYRVHTVDMENITVFLIS